MIEFIKVITPWLVSFGFGILISPLVINFLFKIKAWPRSKENKCEIMNDDGKIDRMSIIDKEESKKTPRMGGFVIIISVFLTVAFFWITSYWINGDSSGKMDFLSRDQTWLPLFAFFIGAVIGFIDDIFTIKSVRIGRHFGLPLKYRLAVVALISAFASIWLYNNVSYIHNMNIPFFDHFYPVGIFIIPIFIIIFTSIFATSNIDGLDGLAGGVMVNVYTAMGVISFFQERFNLAALSFTIAGAVLAFLWFNLPPARYYMGEVGYNALSFALAVIALMTDTLLFLPIIALPLFVNLGVTVLQVFWIRVFKKRLFTIAPMHHIFEEKGWPIPKIVMRYWIVSSISAITGVLLVITDKGLLDK